MLKVYAEQIGAYHANQIKRDATTVELLRPQKPSELPEVFLAIGNSSTLRQQREGGT
ncbi:MAG: hypothetical protein ACLPX5_14105 [Dissulfurispiraceae bacterium]